MAEYGSEGTRIVRARKAYRCDQCGGRIDRGEKYNNLREGVCAGRSWQHREHVDCQAAWWQGDAGHLLSSMALLPGENPPDSQKQAHLQNIPLSLTCDGTDVHVSLSFSPAYTERLLHTPNLEIRREAFEEIARAQALFADCLIQASGNIKLSQQLSHLIQQMAQMTGVKTDTK